jgi:thiol-disulfide isomerase/thioredoxin
VLRAWKQYEGEGIMNGKFSFTANLLDLGWGVLAFAGIVLIVFVPSRDPDVRPFIIATFCSFLAAYSYRVTKSRNIFTTGAFVAVGGIATALTLRALRMALTDTTFLVCYLSAVGSAIFVGFLLSLLRKSGRGGLAAGLAIVSLLVLLTSALRLVPDWINRRAYRTVFLAVAPFTLQTSGGKTISSKDFKGHVVVLSFWATWCPPCRAELPQIESVAQRYRGNSRVMVLAVNAGTNGDTAERARAYLGKRRIEVPWAIDLTGDSSFGPAATSLGTSPLPVLYILDSSGTVRVIHSGFDASEDLRSSLPKQIDRLF